MKSVLRGVPAAVAMMALPITFAPAAMAQSITIAIGSEPSTLDPQLRDDGGERQVNDNIYETLMARAPTGELEPGLAAAAPTQIDELTWEFKLREGVSFHNGEPFNADSVVASVKRVLDPANNSEQLAYFGTISHAEKVDDLNVRTSPPVPIHPPVAHVLDEDDRARPCGEGDLDGTPVGTGPYKFVSWNRGSDITLAAYPTMGRRAEIDQVTYRFITEAGTKMAGLVAGELDIITNLLPSSPPACRNSAVPGLETSVSCWVPTTNSPRRKGARSTQPGDRSRSRGGQPVPRLCHGGERPPRQSVGVRPQ